MNLEKGFKGGKKLRRFSMESGVVVVRDRCRDKKYEQEVRGRVEEGLGKTAAKQRDTGQEGKNRV